MLKRGGQMIPITTSQWKKGGPGNNFVLQHFVEGDELVYYVGEIESMVACESLDSYRIVAIMDLEEVELVTMTARGSDGKTFSTVLSNLWAKVKDGRKEKGHICPVWQIPHKTMLCKTSQKEYHCVYR
jgi:aspartyl aminopeptidase